MLALAHGPMHLHDYCTPGLYAVDVETERRRIHELTVCARAITACVAAGKTPPASMQMGMSAALVPSADPQVFVDGAMRQFTSAKFGAIGPAPAALQPSAMRQQVFVHNERSVWACTGAQLLHWLDQGYYVKEMRCMRINAAKRTMRAAVRFADSWIDREFVQVHQQQMAAHDEESAGSA